MPRQARLDAPGTLHHVIIRGIERANIVVDQKDRETFLSRLGDVVKATGMTIYAWALLPNHAHLLLRSGPQGLPRFMRRFLTGYAITYNRRHRRHGHLFQNRYKSIVVEEDTYFRELVRYIHLNPIRAHLVPDLSSLDRYPWSGHAGILGRATPPWQDRKYVLSSFGRSGRAAIRTYRQYVKEGLPQGRRPELVGGGLVRSLGGWAEVQAVRRRKDPVLTDERILGSGEFVEQMLAAGDDQLRTRHARARALRKAQEIIRDWCDREQISPEELRMGSRRRQVSVVRGHLAALLVARLGLSLADTARSLGVSASGIARLLERIDRK